MHRVVPEIIVENYRAGKYSGEFRAVGMFLDLSGFSTMTDALMQHGQHGAEVLANLMHGVFDPLVESIFGFGGKIIGFAGDGILALFPTVEDPKNVALSALASAWDVQQRLSENGRRRTVYGTFQFSARIGLTYGYASWGILHAEDRKHATYYFRGSAVDGASAAEQSAGIGEILITDELRELMGNLVQAQPSGNFHQVNGFNTDLPGAAPAELPEVDLEISRVFLPEEIIAQNVRGEFRQVVNLFIRFPDMTNNQLANLTRTIFELREKYGGLLSRIDFGDKGCNFLMLWGAPVAYENDIGRALNFVLDLRSLIDIPVTAGLTYYIAHAGYLGSAMCEDYTCYGWGVNLASRFMMNAPLGEIWVDDRIARRVSNRFILEYIGEQRFKGFSAFQRVHRLKSYNRDVEMIYIGEMIGRERELSRLDKFVEPLWKQEFAGVLLLLGDAGIGKGRLVQAFRSSRLFSEQKATWAFCQSEQILRQSFNPFRSWLFHYFRFTSSQEEAERKQVFDAKIDNLIAARPESEISRELDRLRSVLGSLVDLSWPDSLYEQSDAEARYNSTLQALVTLIKAESLQQPFIMYVEDVQFIDEDSMNFLPRLRRALLASPDESYPVAIIATSRFMSRNPLLDTGIVDDQIHLTGLSREAIARLVEILLGGVPAIDLVNLVMDRSEGNPYFVEQIVRYLQDENMIEMSGQGWRQVSNLRESFMPGDIGAVLMARLDQLSRKVREVVQTASVFGREFLLDVLREMLVEEKTVEKYVAEAEQYSIWIGQNDRRYVYTHGLLRDTAYNMQVRTRRQDLHGSAVRALEKIYGEDVRLHYAELAYHSELADLREKAQQYYALAGKDASNAFQNRKGIEYLSRALNFTPLRDMAAQFDLRVERVDLYQRLGDHASYLKELEALDVLANELDDPQREGVAQMLYAVYFVIKSDYPSAIRHAERVMTLNRVIQDTDTLLKTYQVWPLALLRLGKLDEAMRIASEGRRLAVEFGDPVKEGYILISMGLIAIEQKEPLNAQEYLDRALAIGQRTGDRRLESRAWGNLGNFAGMVLQDYSLSRGYWEKMLGLNRMLGERDQEALILTNLGWVSGMLGDFDAAISYSTRSLPILREVGNLYAEANTLINLSANTGVRNEIDASLEYAKKAFELSRATRDKASEAWSYLYMGYAHLARDNFQLAEDAFLESINIRVELGQPGLKMEPQAGLIQSVLRRGDDARALADTEKILAYLETGGSLDGTEEPLRVYYACYLALKQNQDPRSQPVLRSAGELLETQVSKLRDEKSRQMFIENVPWRLAIHRAWKEMAASPMDNGRPEDPLHSM
jgi:class 3 adenylate cyclase/tetratricopeptide (TPR) repeat protein